MYQTIVMQVFWSKGAFSKLCESKKGCGGTCLPKLSDLWLERILSFEASPACVSSWESRVTVTSLHEDPWAKNDSSLKRLPSSITVMASPCSHSNTHTHTQQPSLAAQRSDIGLDWKEGFVVKQELGLSFLISTFYFGYNCFVLVFAIQWSG